MTSHHGGHRFLLGVRGLPNIAVQLSAVNERTAGDHISVGFAA